MLAILVYWLTLPQGAPIAGALAVTVFAAVLWISEALPLPVTALLIPVGQGAVGVFEARDAYTSFGSSVLFLVLGGYALAVAVAIPVLWWTYLDHQAVYLLIAGTYTPFTMVALEGARGWWMFGAIWGLAVFGIVLDALPRRGPRVVPLIIYLVMGWLCLFALDPIVAALPPAGFVWLLAGGIFYTSGIVFFVLDHWYPWCHGIWHLFVLAGSVSHYFSILLLY